MSRNRTSAVFFALSRLPSCETLLLATVGVTTAFIAVLIQPRAALTQNASPEAKITKATKSPASIEFSFTAFGDSGWANTHKGRPVYTGGFTKSFNRFDNNQVTLGDINYINWETSVGKQCDKFWSKQTPSTFAFLTHPQELEDTIKLGFNVIGLANNHTFDCLRSPEGNGPIQTYNYISKFRQANKNIAFSGVFKTETQEPVMLSIKLEQGDVPITFLSAYVGGYQGHCSNITCTLNLSKYKPSFKDTKRLRILALHSWNKSSHNQLKTILRSWVKNNLVDIAIGTGPHIAEKIEIVNTSNGKRIIATSLGNFIHPSLSRQSNNSVLQSKWNFNPRSSKFNLLSAEEIKASCDGESCVNTGMRKLF